MDQIENIATQAIDSVRQKDGREGGFEGKREKLQSTWTFSVVSVEVFPNSPSTFHLQTVGRNAKVVPQMKVSSGPAACITYASRALKLKVSLLGSPELNTSELVVD